MASGAKGGASFAAAGAGRGGGATFKGDTQGQQQQQPEQQQPARAPPHPGTGPVAQLKAGLAEARRGWRAAAPSLRRVWLVDLAFNAWSLPLQAASLLVLPVFWTFPRLLAIQLAVPAAVLAGTAPAASLARSRQLMAKHAAAYAWPYLALTLGARGLDAGKQALLLAVPERWWREVIEVPIAVTIGFAIAKLLLVRMQDLLPLATYLRLQKEEGGGATIGGSGGGGSGDHGGSSVGSAGTPQSGSGGGSEGD
jgi:hypothetical protein